MTKSTVLTTVRVHGTIYSNMLHFKNLVVLNKLLSLLIIATVVVVAAVVVVALAVQLVHLKFKVTS